MNTDVRLSSAIHALGRVGTEMAVPNLLPMLLARDEWIRLGDAHALGQIGESAQSAIPMLVQTLCDQHEDVRYNAVNGLILIGLPSITTLIAALKNEDRFFYFAPRMSGVASGNRPYQSYINL